MSFDDDKMVADKCTYCAHRLAKGEQPACVTKCPGHALSFGKASELASNARSEGRAVKEINSSSTKPSTLYLERIKA